MSLTEVRIKGTPLRVPLGGLIHSFLVKNEQDTKNAVIENQGDTPIYTMLKIKNSKKSLGAGSTGTVYAAAFVLSGSRVDCVVKLPNDLLKSKEIVVGAQGDIRAQHSSSQRFKNALQDLELEWRNGFLLHYGKQMSDTLIGGPTNVLVASKAFRSAARRADALRHQWGYAHVHQLLAIDTSVPCLISEYYEMALLAWARKETRSRKTIMATIMPQIMAGLHYMHHCAQLAHMDIKPNNMLCSLRAGETHLVLCDFGASADANAVSKELRGTVGYMAPEICNKIEYVPKFTDAFSFAVSVLHLLHPEIQCDTEEQQNTMLQHIKDAATEEDDQSVCCRLLSEREPARRYAIFDEAVQASKARGLWVHQRQSR